MRVLVTGAGGFVGRKLVPLLAKAHDVVAMDCDCSDLESLGASRVVEGDLADAAMRARAIKGVDAVIHLATVPGGAAEEQPRLAQEINVEATMNLSLEVAAARRGAAFVFASSIAVFGHPLPAQIDDATPVAPVMLYGAHKAMIEAWLAALTRREDLAALSLRLPGIVARPRAPSGMKSAFMSDLFHAVAAREAIELPVSSNAMLWLMSVEQVARCLAHGLAATEAVLPAGGAITLPSLRVRMEDLVTEICRQIAADLALVTYRPDAAIEQGFGSQPPLRTRMAESLGFTHDGDLERLVRSALETLQ